MATDPGLSFFLVVGRYLSDQSWYDAAIIKTYGCAVILNSVAGT